MKTEVAALMHRDSGLTLIIHNTENPTDTQVSDHLTVTLHIFFSLKKKKRLPLVYLFLCSFYRDLTSMKRHFARQEL